MKILADENIEREFIEALREADFDVLSIRESHIGSADDEILQIAVEQNSDYDLRYGFWRIGLSPRFKLVRHNPFASSRSGFDGENRQNDFRFPRTRI
jgi:hypothetical protein